MFQDSKFILVLFISLFLKFSTSTDTITLLQPLQDGDVLVSKEKNFALGFFRLVGNSSNRYVGIWYNKVSEQTVVWVANRDRPITNSSCILSIDETGNLVLHDKDQKYVFWSTNVSSMVRDSVSAQLLDSGNLVLFQDQNRNAYSWQSFDYPSHTILPGMKFGLDKKTGLNRMITSWNSNGNPGVGKYIFKMEFVGFSHVFLYKGKTRIYRTGSWTGNGWSGGPQIKGFIFNVTYVNNNDEVYYSYLIPNSSIFSRLVINESGIVESLTWHEANRRWIELWSAPKDQCDSYNHCGPFGYCDPYKSGTFECTCFPGYEPQSSQDWNLRDGTGGCKRKVGAAICLPGAGFVELASVKIPDMSTAGVSVNMSLGLKACEDLCHKNCTCFGYAIADISKEIGGCITWYKDMIDTRTSSNGANHCI